MKRFFLLLLLVSAVLPALACKCEQLPPLSKESVAPYELIFTGRVAAVAACTDEGRATVRFTIDSLYRGKAYVETDLQFDCASSCAMSFAPGERWLIYATYVKYGVAQVQLCSHSRKQAPANTTDYTADLRGTTFVQETQWLTKNIGIVPLNTTTNKPHQTRQLIHPDGMDTIWLLVIGAVALVVVFFLGRRFLK